MKSMQCMCERMSTRQSYKSEQIKTENVFVESQNPITKLNWNTMILSGYNNQKFKSNK